MYWWSSVRPPWPGSNLPAYFASRRRLETIRLHTAEWDQRLRSFGIRVHLLKECPGTLAGMIYLYREKWLTQLVAEKERRAFLEQHGYYAERLPEMLEQLSPTVLPGAGIPP